MDLLLGQLNYHIIVRMCLVVRRRYVLREKRRCLVVEDLI